MTAGPAVQAVPAGSGTAPGSPWPGLAVPAAALAPGWALLRFRDS